MSKFSSYTEQAACLMRRQLLASHFVMLMILVLTAILSSSAHADIILNGTRIIYDDNKRDALVVVSNPSDRPYAVQVWINTDLDDNSTIVPFVTTPQLFRLDAGKEQSVRILRLPANLPSDRESLFFLNAQEIPSATPSAENSLKIAIRTRVKLFFRPKQLRGSLYEALAMLKWSLVQKAGQSVLHLTNPSAFHISFVGIYVEENGKKSEIADPKMVAPMSEIDYSLATPITGNGAQVSFSAINDSGGYTELKPVALTSTR